MMRLVRPYDFILDRASGWRPLESSPLEADVATVGEDGVQLQPLAQRHPALIDPHGTFGGITLPRGLAVWGDQVFIADPLRHRILHWEPCCGPAKPLETIGGCGMAESWLPGAEPRQLDTPLGLAISQRDDLVVVDSGNRRLQLFTLPGLALRRIVGPLASRLPGPPSGEDAAWAPVDVARGPHGQLYVADSQGFVWRLDSQGRPDPGFDGALPGGFIPLRIVVDCQGRVYLVGQDAPSILILDAYGNPVPEPDQLVAELADPLAAHPPQFLKQALPGSRLGLRNNQVLLEPDSRECWRQPLATDLYVDEDGRLELDDVDQGPYLAYYPPAATFSPVGLYRVQPLDSKRLGNPWHRLTLEVDVPERTGIRVFTSTSDVLQPTLRGDGLLAEPPHADPWQAGPDNADEFLIQSPPGRYLYLALTLKGPGDRTPTIKRIYVHAHRHSSLHYLPAVYQADETSRSVLDRLLSLTDTLFGEIESQIEDLALLLDAAGAPADFLPWLASWFDLTLEQAWTEAQQRAFLQHIVELYRWRGTIRGMRLMLQLHANLQEPMPQVVEYYRGIGQPILETWLGEAPEGDAPHHFGVLLPAHTVDTEEKRAIVERLIDSNKPAHTHFSIRPIVPGLRLGSTSVRGAALGLDSLLGDHPQWRLPDPGDWSRGSPQLTSDQDGALGATTALPATGAPRAVSVRLGATRLGEARLGCRICVPCRQGTCPQGKKSEGDCTL